MSNTKNTGYLQNIIRYDSSNNITLPATLTSEAFIKNGGTSLQFLKADGSVDNNLYLTTSYIPDWSVITNIPSIVLTTNTYSNPSWLTTLAWSKITGTPTTVAGYGITNIAAQLSFIAGSGAYNQITGLITIPTNNSQLINGADYTTTTAVNNLYVPYTDAHSEINLNTQTLRGIGNLNWNYDTGLNGISLHSGNIVIGRLTNNGFVDNSGETYISRDGELGKFWISQNGTVGLTSSGSNTFISYEGYIAFNKLVTLNDLPTYTSGGEYLVNNVGTISKRTAAQVLSDIGSTPTSRTLTINGITFDLSANRNWSINPMVYPSAGIALSTGSAWGTSITDNSANWDTAYNRSITNMSFIGGALTLTKQDASTLSTSLDGRYAKLVGDTFTGFITLNADPTSALHAATKNYVDQVSLGLNWKHSVRVSTTTTLSTYTVSGSSTILTASSNGVLNAQDGVTLSNGDRILVKNEVGANRVNNGGYIITSIGSVGTPWVLNRMPDSNTSSSLQGATYYILEGSTELNRVYSINVSPITMGTTILTLSLIAGPSTYVNGIGLTLSGNVFAIDNTVVILSGSQTLTNKIISGSSNTISNIANSSLINSSLTIGSTTISLGGTSTTLGGLTSVISTLFTGALTGLASGNELPLTMGVGMSRTGNTISTTITQYTDILARASLSFAAGSGAYNQTSGIITIPTNNSQITNGANYITLTSLSSTAIGLTYTNTTGVFSLTSGYSIPTISSQTNWDTTYTNRITSLTIIGNSGAATLISNVLNIPTYTIIGLGGLPLTGGTMSGPINMGSQDINSANGVYAGLLNSTGYINASTSFQLVTANIITNTSTVAEFGNSGYWTSSKLFGNGGLTSITVNSSGLTISTIPALATTATTFLTSNTGVISSRTVAQVLSDIGAIGNSFTLNGLNFSTNQTFAIGTTGIDFNISSIGSTHTFNIPNASATARGLINISSQTLAGNKTFTGRVTSSFIGTAFRASGNSGTFEAVYGTNISQLSPTYLSINEQSTGYSIELSPTGITVSSDIAFINLRNITATIDYLLIDSSNLKLNYLLGTGNRIATLDSTGKFIRGTIDPANIGSVTSITGTGSVSGISLSGTVTTSGNITLGGTISGLTTTNLSSSAAITNGQLANSTISGIALGSSLFALTIGTDLSGSSYNGSSSITINATSTLATVTGRGASTSVGVTLNQNGNLSTSYALYGQRNTNTSSLGYLVQFQTAGVSPTNLFAIDVNGNIISGSYQGTAITNTYLENSTISGVSLGGNLFNHIAGSGLSGSTYNGSSAITWSIATAGITNAMLVNSSVTLGSTIMTLGSTYTTIIGLSSITSTSFIGALIGNSSTATTLASGRTISITGDIAYTSPSFDGSSNITAVGTLASIIVAGGPIGSATVVPIITYDAKGRLTVVSSATIAPLASSITGGAALTKVDDTNITLTLGGTPATALLQTASITVGWTGTLADARITSSTNWNTAYNNRIQSGLLSARPVVGTNNRNYYATDNGIEYFDNGTSWVIKVGALSGDITSVANSLVTTLAIVNSNIGTFGTSILIPLVTVNAKGLITAISSTSIPTSSTTITGLLTNTDWNTFNNKENVLSFTTGLSRTGNTITNTVTQYTDTLARAALSFSAGSGAYNPLTGSITIPTNNNQILNGANYITLTGLSSTALGLTYTNTSGIFSLTSGYLIPTTASYNNSNWDIAYTNRIISFSTTGNSGAATFASNTLNIPNYTFNGLSPMTNAGDIIYGGVTGVATRLAAGTATQVLHGGTTPSWSAISLTTDVIGLLPNANLANNSIIIQGTSTALGGSVNIINGTGFVKGSGTTISFDNNTYISLLGGVTMTGLFTLSGDPVSAYNPATKNYVDNLVTGLSWKQASRAATTVNIILSGTQIIDGISVIIGDRILVKNQTISTQNGIYNVASGAWTRVLDADISAEIWGATVFIENGGTLNGGTQWSNSNTTSPVIGTDNITFVQIAGAGVYTYGTYLSLIGNVFDVNTTYSGQWNTAYAKRLSSVSLASSLLTITLADATTITSVIPTFNQNTTGNAATVTTNANLTGVVTSVGNATSIANGAITNAMLANTAVANLSGTNTGDNAVNSLYSGLVSNATHTGDATGATVLTVVGLRGVVLPALTASAGLLKYTGTTINTWVFDTSTYLTSITSGQVTTALGFTPYNNTNPSGYISGNQTITLSGDISGSGTTAITTTLATVTQSTGASFVKITLDTKGRVTGNTAVGSGDITGALGYTPYNSTNPSGYTSNVGTVTSISGTGTVSGLTLSGTVTVSGSLTLGGNLSLTSGNVTTALGYTPYNATNPSGYISSITTAMVNAVGTISNNTTGNAATLTNFVSDPSRPTFDYNLAGRENGFYSVSAAGSNGPGTAYLTVIHGRNGSDTGLQIAGGYVSDNLYFRGTSGLNTGTGWTTWRTVLHSGNYNSYSPTLTGGGVSGASWAIGITGNAATTSQTNFGSLTVGGTQVVTNNGSTWNIAITGNSGTTTLASNSSLLTGYAPNQTGGGNSIVQRDVNGYIQNSYFYTSGGGSERNASGMGYFAGFNSGDYYIRSYTAAAVQTLLGLGSMAYQNTGTYYTASTSDGRYFIDRGFITYPSWDANTIPSNSSGFTYSNNAPTTGCLAYFGAGGYGLQLNGSYGGQYLAFRNRNGDTASWNAWRELLHTGNYNSYSPTLTGGGASGTWGINITGNAAGETLATVTGRGAGTSGSITINGGLTVGNTTASYIYMTDTDETTRILHCNSNRIGFLNSSSGWGAYCDNSGNFYAANLSGTNTGDQNLSSYATHRGEGTNYVDYSRYVYNNGAYSGTGWTEPSDLGVRYAYSATISTQVTINYSNASNSTYQMLWGSGNSVYGASGIYCNPSINTIYATTLSGALTSGAATTNGGDGWWRTSGNAGWFNSSYGVGIYSTAAGIVRTYNGASFFVEGEYQGNCAGYYGSISVGGQKNGYSGIHNSYSNTIAGMFDGSGNGGDYDTTTGWHIYWSRANACLGIGGSNTSSSYKAFINGNTYSDGFIRSTSYIKTGSDFFADANYGYGLVGLYNSTIFQGIFAMGDAYRLTAGGGSGNLYGLSWSYPAAGGQAANLSSHGMLVMINGVTQVALSSNIWCIGNIIAYSDARVKDNIEIITNSLSKIHKVRGVTYNRTDQEDKDKRHAGVIAQDFLEILPEVVSTNSLGMHSVAYGNISSLLIEGIKELDLKVNSNFESLEEKITRLDKEITSLKNQLNNK